MNVSKESWRDWPHREKRELLITVARVNRAVEQGKLDPAAKEIALCMAGGREKVWDEFLGGGIWDFIGDLEEMTAERQTELRSNLETYLKTCRLLNLGDHWTRTVEVRLQMLSLDE